MNPLNLVTDRYERQARLYPALVVIAPIAVTVLALMSMKLSGLESLGAIVGGCGGIFLLSQLARDAGKNGEKALFEGWGGTPSVTIFRHRDTRLDSITKARYHKTLAVLVKGAKAPSVEEERVDPTAADLIYTSWSSYLRVKARDDAKKYPLVLQENVNYGYRRNLRGLRTLGIITTTLCCTIAIVWSYVSYRATGKVSEELAGAFTLGLLFLLLWIFRFSPSWVRLAADAYAERLAETVDTISAKVPARTK